MARAVASLTKDKNRVAAGPYLNELIEDLRACDTSVIGQLTLGDRTIELVTGRNSLWIVVRRPGLGGMALRAVFLMCAHEARVTRKDPANLRVRIDSALGRHELDVEAAAFDLTRMRVCVRFTPSAPIRIPYQPRDLYPFDADGNPRTTEGTIEAAQRGVNSGLLYFNLQKPAFGHVLYFQNLTSLNGYFRASGTGPSGIVGGEWPELGMLLPTTPLDDSNPLGLLPANEEVVLSDAFIVMRENGGDGEADSARWFLQMLGAVYRAIDLPDTEYRDWIRRSDQTLADLENAPEATVRHYGNLYIRPYVDAEYPDIMVQMTVLASIHAYGQWRGKPHPLEARLKRGLAKFHDARLGTMRRYLPNVGKDKNKDAVDSWYLYHPLLNLGRLAIAGDEQCAKLLAQSLEYAIRTARHFKYMWPIQFNIEDYSIIVATAADDRGQTDVGGLYAYVMLQAHQLTGETRFLNEARKAIDVAMGMRFDLNYQANLTAWGAAACSHMIVADAPFRIFCDHFIRAHERSDSKALSVQIDGGETCWAKLCVMPLGKRKPPKVTLRTADGEAVRASRTDRERIEFVIPANGRVILNWS